MSGKSTGNSRASRSRSTSDGAMRAGGERAGAERASTERGAGSSKSRAEASRAEASRAEDIALVCGLTEDGQGVEVIRKRGDRLEAGTVRRLEAGKPIHGEVVRLRPRSQAPLVCDVEVEFEGAQRDGGAGAPRDDVQAPAAALRAASSGPPQVATESYRKNWDAVYGRSRKPSLLN